jgi:hypothetical protein
MTGGRFGPAMADLSMPDFGHQPSSSADKNHHQPLVTNTLSGDITVHRRHR